MSASEVSSCATPSIAFDALLMLAADAADGMLLSPAPLPQPKPAGYGAITGARSSEGEGGTARTLLLTVQRAVLSSWLAGLQAVQSIFVIVRGELEARGAQGGVAQGGVAPLMLRSATMRKRGAALDIGARCWRVGRG